jgi:hypothetical protein
VITLEQQQDKIAAQLAAIQKTGQQTGQSAAGVIAAAVAEPEQKSAFETRALPLIELNVPVIPLTPRTKRAFINKWENIATTDPAKIAQWGQDYPEANVASVAKAEPDGVWFFDADRDGLVQQIETTTGQKIPATFMVRSQQGKGHYYFRQNAASIAMGNRQASDENGELWSARVSDRYVVGPKSVHPDTGKQYEVINDAPIVEAPQWLIDFCIQNDAKETKQKTGDRELDDESLVHEGGRNTMLTSVLGRARQVLGMSKDQLLAYGLSVNAKRCRPPLAESEVRTIANSIGGYAVKETGGIEFPVQATTEDLSWLDLNEVAARPVFPDWIMKSTSLYQGLAKPVSDVNSKFPELIWLPAVQLMLNYLHNKVSISGMRLNVNIFLGIISSPGKFFKSSSCRLAHEYFGHMGLAVNLTPSLRNSEGKIVIGQAGSSEGFGLQLQNANAKHAILFNGELGKLVSKAGIENASLTHDLLLWYESEDFSNPIKSRAQSFAFPPGTYCFGWQFCTTTRGFNSQWPRIAGIASGMPDRTFFLVTPEEPKPLSSEVFVNTVETAIGTTRKLIDRAVEKKEYQISEYAQDSLLKKSAAFGDPRSMNMVYKFALYFAIDLGLDEIDEDCIARALALVDYRQKAIAFLQPIEAKNDEGRLLKEMLRELRQHGGKMTRRELYRAMHAEEYGDRFWRTVYGGALGANHIREFKERGAHGQIKHMVGLVKDDVQFGPE